MLLTQDDRSYRTDSCLIATWFKGVVWKMSAPASLPLWVPGVVWKMSACTGNRSTAQTISSHCAE